MSVYWDTRPEDAVRQLAEAYINLLHAELLRLAQRWAPRIERWMKQNAVWTDRTGNARQTLFTEVINMQREAVIILISHGVNHGVFLELSHGGSYAIVTPALDHFAPLIWRDIVQLLRL